VLQSCGITPNYFQKKVIWFLLPISLIMALVSLYVSPWSYQKERELIQLEESYSPITGLVAGKFNPLPNDTGVFYAKEIAKSGELEEVWLKVKSEQQEMILIAPNGAFVWIDGQVVLQLKNGYSYQGLEQAQEVTVQKFTTFEGYLPEFSVTKSKAKLYEAATIELWAMNTAEAQALIQWRIATP